MTETLSPIEVLLFIMGLISWLFFALAIIGFVYILFRAASFGWYKSKWEYLKRTLQHKGDDNGKA